MNNIYVVQHTCGQWDDEEIFDVCYFENEKDAQDFVEIMNTITAGFNQDMHIKNINYSDQIKEADKLLSSLGFKQLYGLDYITKTSMFTYRSLPKGFVFND